MKNQALKIFLTFFLLTIAYGSIAQVPYKIYGDLWEYQNYKWFKKPKPMSDSSVDTLVTVNQNTFRGKIVNWDTVGTHDPGALTIFYGCFNLNAPFYIAEDYIKIDTCYYPCDTSSYDSVTHVLTICDSVYTLAWHDLWVRVIHLTDTFLIPRQTPQYGVSIGTLSHGAKLTVDGGTNSNGISTVTQGGYLPLDAMSTTGDAMAARIRNYSTAAIANPTVFVQRQVTGSVTQVASAILQLRDASRVTENNGYFIVADTGRSTNKVFFSVDVNGNTVTDKTMTVGETAASTAYVYNNGIILGDRNLLPDFTSTISNLVDSDSSWALKLGTGNTQVLIKEDTNGLRGIEATVDYLKVDSLPKQDMQTKLTYDTTNKTIGWAVDTASGAPGSGTVTSIAQGLGMLNSVDPIITVGTVGVDSTTVVLFNDTLPAGKIYTKYQDAIQDTGLLSTSGDTGYGNYTFYGNETLSKQLYLSATGTDSTTGVIRVGGIRYFHTYTQSGGFGALIVNKNLFFGHNAGNFTASGWASTAVGNSTLASLTSGIGNSMFGNWAGKSITTGIDNTGLGYGVMENATTGVQNTAVGAGALRIVSGKYNNAVGSNSLRANTTGYGNNAMGVNTSYNITTGSGNISIGDSSLFTNVSGNSNIAIGSFALNKNTASENIGIGYGALNKNVGATGNTGIGINALANNTVGIKNTAVGYMSQYTSNGNAGYSEANTSVGYKSLYSLTNGYYNGAYGQNALYSNTTGYENIGTGDGVLYTNSTGNANSYYGGGAGYNATGSNGIGIGNNSGRFNTLNNRLFINAFNRTNLAGDTTKSIIYGYMDATASLQRLTINAQVTIPYNLTLPLTTSTEGAISIGTTKVIRKAANYLGLGSNAGSSLTGGKQNTFVGDSAGYNASQKVDAVNSTAIGNGAYTTADNQVVIGNSSVTTTKLKGYVGIGPVTPATNLDISLEGTVPAAALAPASTFGLSVASEASGSGCGLFVTKATGTNTSRGLIRFARARGTLDTPTAVAENDYLGSLSFAGYDGVSALQTGALIDAYVDSAVVAGKVNMRLAFTTGGSYATRFERLIIKHDGTILTPYVYETTVGATNRDLYIDNTGLLGYVSSSIKYKAGVKPMESVDWIYKLRPVNYYYKKDSTQAKQYGLIAEEVDKINPAFVSYDKDGNPETVSYSQLVVPLLKALQDQKKQIEALELRIDKLENKK